MSKLKIEKGKWYTCIKKIRYGKAMFFNGVTVLCQENDVLVDTLGNELVFNESFERDGYNIDNHFRLATENEIPTEEQEIMDFEHRRSDCIYFLDTAKKHYASTVELDACIEWLKRLKNRR